jgi:3'(2'), 5'-bisphosphate nucleotidase
MCGYVVNGKTIGMWTIDPIDGTKGFLRGEQYAVCLSLIVDSKVQVGVIGCPNLPVDPAHPEKGTGCIFTAVRGQGAQQVLNHLYLCLEYLELIHLFFS